jgi:acyl carrier protein
MTENEILTFIQRKMPFPGKPHLASRLSEDLGFDSALLMDLIFSLEEQLGKSYPMEAVNRECLSTPKTLLGVVNRYMT